MPRLHDLPPRQRVYVIVALLALYLVWGSTYLAMRYAIEGFPPLMMAGIRFVIAGGVFMLALRARGSALPTRAEWRGAAITGGLLLVGGNGAVAYAEQWIGSGVAALAIATVPLWTVIFSTLWGQGASRREWLGIAIGFAGVALLSFGPNFGASILGAILLLFAAASWSFGSVLSKHLPRPAGMMSSAAQMLAGGVLLMGASLLAGERLTSMPSIMAVSALAYLIVFGSFIGYTSYQYVFHTVRPALATSYAYVNPVVAMVLGWALAGEHIGAVEWAAMGVILAGVVIVLVGPGDSPMRA